MEFKLALVFITLALVGADEQTCQEEKGEPCVVRLLTAVDKDDISEEEACLEMRMVVNCLRNAVDECRVGDRDVEVDAFLEQLEAQVDDNCKAAVRTMDSVDVDVEACFVKNVEYIMDCYSSSLEETNTMLGNPEEIDKDVFECAFSLVVVSCVKDRTTEKCGEKAGNRANKEMADMRVKKRDACSTQASIKYFTNMLAKDMKRK